MINLFFGTHAFFRLQTRSPIHPVPLHCFRQPGFKICRTSKKSLWNVLPTFTDQTHSYHFSLVRTITEITESISNRISEILLTVPMKQIKVSGMGDLKAGQSKFGSVFQEVILPASTWEVTGLAC